MQTLLLPAVRSGSAPAISSLSLAAKPSPSHLISASPQPISFKHTNNLPSSLSSFFLSPQSLHYTSKSNHTKRILASAPISAAYTSSNDESEKAKLAQVISRTLVVHFNIFLWNEVNVVWSLGLGFYGVFEINLKALLWCFLTIVCCLSGRSLLINIYYWEFVKLRWNLWLEGKKFQNLNF